jgi:hypothetical protein
MEWELTIIEHEAKKDFLSAGNRIKRNNLLVRDPKPCFRILFRVLSIVVPRGIALPPSISLFRF